MAIATMGFVGHVTIDGKTIRAESADIKMKQDIELPGLVDGKYDKTAYFLKPREIEGSIAFPAVLGDGSSTIFSSSYDWAWQRNADGRLIAKKDIAIKYYGGWGYNYKGCIFNNWEFTAEQGGMVKVNTSVIGTTRQKMVSPSTVTPIYSFAGNSRVVGWNDVQIQIATDTGSIVSSTNCNANDGIRSFNWSIANNATRFYAMGCLTPVDIAAGKRQITGSLKIMGVNPVLQSLAGGDSNGDGNNSRCTAQSTIDVRIAATCAGGPGFSFDKVIGGVIFQIEQIGINNELVQSSINWKSLPGCPDFPNAPKAIGATC